MICFHSSVNRFLPTLCICLLVLILFSVAPFIGVAELGADVTMPPVFGDHMILQQGMTLPVWGSASPGERVSVSCSGRYAETRADDAGRWRVTLRPLLTSFDQVNLVVKIGRAHV